jgi:hypothetical protein
VKASRIRPGALVRDNEGNLQVVVKVRRDPDLHPYASTYATFADGREEEWPPGLDVEVVKLTEAQVGALRNVDGGEVHRDWTPKVGRYWRMGNAWQPLRSQPYVRLVELRMISVRTRRSLGGCGTCEDYEPTPMGSALLGAMKAKEATR